MTTTNTNAVYVAAFRKDIRALAKSISNEAGVIASLTSNLFNAIKAGELDTMDLIVWAEGTEKVRAAKILHDFLEFNSPDYVQLLVDIKSAEEKETKRVLDANLRALRNRVTTALMIALATFKRNGEVEAPQKGTHKGRLLIGVPSESDDSKVIYSQTPVNAALSNARSVFRGAKPANERKEGTTVVEQQKALATALAVIRELAPGMTYDSFSSATKQVIVEAYAALEAIVDNDKGALEDLRKFSTAS